jgi:hypothetical protein
MGQEQGGVLPVSGDDRKKPDKYYRIEGTLEPLHRMKLLVFNEAEKNDKDMQRLIAQFLSVSPNSKTMDGPDAVEGAVIKIRDKLHTEAAGGIEMLRRPTNSKRY